MSNYHSTQINEVLEIQPGDWFFADIIGYGIYEMVKNGVNHRGNKFAIVKCQKIFGEGFRYRGHETTCHPISPAEWNSYKVLKRNKMEESKVKTADKQNDNIKLIVKLEQIRNSTYNLFGKKPLAFEKSFLKNLNANGVFLFHTDKPFKDMQFHITKLEATNSEYKKQIGEYEFHLIEARRVKDNAKLKLISEQNKHAEYLREAGEKFIELEARNKELEEALQSTLWVAKYYDKGKYKHMTGKAEQALNNK